MKTLFRLIPLVLLATGTQAQIEVSMKLPGTVFLTGESVHAVVTIKNNTSAAIPVGGADGYRLDFDLKNADGHPVAAREDRAPVSSTLPAGGSVTVTNDLYLCFALLAERQVGAAAVVSLQGRTFASKREYFDLQQGAEMARLKVNLGTRTITQTLRMLQRANHTHLFLRSDDEAGGTTFGAVYLGPLLRASPPQYMLDRENRTHIVHRAGPEQFSYHVAGADGGLIRREDFTGDYQIVRLVANADGSVTCTGMPGNEKDRPKILQQTPFKPDLHREMKPR